MTEPLKNANDFKASILEHLPINIKVNVITNEDDDKCELCGTIAELRPYGPNCENICYECGMKDEETTNGMIRKRFGFE